MATLSLPDGRTVARGERTEGGSKNETRYGLTSDGLSVVVKIQRTHGRLVDEEVALRFLGESGIRVPRVSGSGETEAGEPFLVVSREDGVRTREPDGWRQFSRDLAALVAPPTVACPLRRVETAGFIEERRHRLDIVEHLLEPWLASRIAAALDQIADTRRLVVTHGDPGTGNYLFVGDQSPGTILDWETASVSRFGLDLGRAAFIGLLDLRKTGQPMRLARSVVAGYREVCDEVPDELLRAWAAIAGLQCSWPLHATADDRTDPAGCGRCSRGVPGRVGTVPIALMGGSRRFVIGSCDADAGERPNRRRGYRRAMISQTQMWADFS